VEWYDFTSCLYFAPTSSRVFFGPGKDASGNTSAGFAIAYSMRPFGAVSSGVSGDRKGRKPASSLSMAAMTSAMSCIASSPTYRQAGAWAGWGSIVMRCSMGFSVGGEYTSVVTYSYETAPAHRRGSITSSAAAASEIGGLSAVGSCAVSTSTSDAASLDGWGWRVPFSFGAVSAGAIWSARG
ncbi:hypothetical protein OY671_010167, partial [Metschnikowia pulcherrima]